MPHPRRRLPARLAARVLPLLLVAGLGACALIGRRSAARAPSQWLVWEVRRVLDTDDPSPEFFRRRARLEGLGGELDDVLVGLIRDSRIDEKIRANAIRLLADRRSPVAVDVLRRALLTVGNDQVRAAAVLGLHQLSADSPPAANAALAAVGDPAPSVRLAALQGLDAEDAPLLRALLAREEDRQVRVIGRQLLGLLEARGAPLVADATGHLRTSGPDSLPRIVFHPARVDTAARLATGALWVELPGGKGLVPLATEVEVVADVVPAFFDPHGQRVVYESERQIRIRDLRTGATRVVGPGIAPRPLPFTDRFVFLEEVRGERREEGGGTRITYRVVRTSFHDGRLERLGTLRALARPDRNRNASPARRMVVGEVREGFVLRGPGISPFLLPNPFEGGAAPPRRP